MTQTWTKEAALQRLQNNALVQAAMRMEPQLQHLVQQAQHQRNEQGYHRIRTWQSMKRSLRKVVGWEAHNPQLRTQAHWEAVDRAINDLLPPDDVDLYPDGKPDDEAEA